MAQQPSASFDLIATWLSSAVSWLNLNAGAIQAVATIVLVGVGWMAFRAAAVQAGAARAVVGAAETGCWR